MTNFAFIGFGEAGGLLAKGLIAAGATVSATYDVLIGATSEKSRALIEKATQMGVRTEAHPQNAIKNADIVISAVVSNEMVNAARRVAPYLAKDQIYFDINSASPMAKKEACVAVENAGGHFVEAAVMDLVPPHGHKVPMLLAGKRAKQVEPVLQSYGMNVRAIGETIGVASTIKMVRSVFLKGFSAILLESLVAAGKVGAEEEVINSLQVTFPQLDWHKLSDYYANRLVKHARRQAAEMHEVAETLEYLKLEPLMATATAKRLEWLADRNLDDGHCKMPDTYKELLSELGNNGPH